MSRKITSPPSIEEALEFTSKDQYIANLKVQCRMREEALRTAQSLIEAYQKQNQSLREQIKTLKLILQQNEQKLKHHQTQQETIKKLQKNILRYSQKVNQLLQKNALAERKIRNLQNQLRAKIQQQKNQRQYIEERLSRQRQNQKQNKELQSQFHNFLKLPPRDSSFEYSPKYQKYSPGKQSFATAATKGESKKVDNNIKVLEWKLKQKNQQVMILLKRMNDLEERTRKAQIEGRRQKILTQQSLENFSSQKAYNISQFTQ